MTDWLKVAEALPIGRSRKIVHACNPNGDPSLSVVNEPECYRAYCHRCKERLFEAKVLPLGELIRINQERREADRTLRSQAMPEPRTYGWDEWPVEAQLWLLKAGIGEVEAQRLGIYYHAPSMRVVLPYHGTHHWQARAVMQGHKPKYISDGGTRSCHCVFNAANRKPPTVVLTEDLLSTYKVQLTGVPAMPLLGTTLHDEHLAYLLYIGADVAVWLDPDGPGQAAASKICARLEVFGIRHVNVLSDRDPKLYTRGEVLQILEDAWH